MIAQKVTQASEFGFAYVNAAKVEGLVSRSLVHLLKASIIPKYLQNSPVSFP